MKDSTAIPMSRPQSLAMGSTAEYGYPNANNGAEATTAAE